MARPGSISSIAPHAPFLPTLADALVSGTILPNWRREGPFWLSDMTIYLPTRRAATRLSRLIAERLGDQPMLLPDIRPLGGEDPAQEPFLPPYEPITLPPPINRFKRRLLLAELVEKWLATQRGATAFSAPGLGGHSGPPNSAEILALADTLGTLIDDFAIARIEPSRLAEIDDAQLAGQFQANLDFVSFVLGAWPSILEAEGEMEAASRTNALLERKAASLSTVHGDRPVIVAGSTGSIPTTADLIAAIADLPNGAVVLAGLDTTMDVSTAEILRDPRKNPHGHPQYGLIRLLRRLGTPPEAVIELAQAPSPRTDSLNAALGLPDATADWARFAADRAKDLSMAANDLSLLRAKTPEEEARAIALCVHDALAKHLSVAIIAPDQTLARRICAELARFDIALDDAAGTPLTRSRAGRLVRQAVTVLANGLDPVDLMALLRNRHVTVGLGRAVVAPAAESLEMGALRGQRPLPGFDGLRRAIADNLEKRTPYPAQRLNAESATEALALLDAIEAALEPLSSLLAGPFSASGLATAIAETMERLRLQGPDETIAALEGEDELDRWLELAQSQGDRGPRFAPSGLALALEGLMAGPSVRPRRPDAEDVVLFGRLEARLMGADRMILAGMTESVWPEIADPGPWMSRGMRLAVGLEPPEKLHGLAAHDFLMAAGTGEVVFTLPERSGTAPATPSRLIQRIEALLGDALTKDMEARGGHFVDQARRLDATGVPPRPAGRPAPNPPASVRPRSLSITEAETLLRSPYDIYARYVLGLRRIDPLGADPDYAERGNLIHDILGDFIHNGHDPLARNAFAIIMDLAHGHYARLDALPSRRDLWLKRFEAIAEAFLEFERQRTHIAIRRAEVSGKIELPFDSALFTLRGRADRIDRGVLGTLEIIDFKTGQAPQPKEMKQFFAPQLPLEAKMAELGAFGPDLAHRTEAMSFIKLSHGPEALKPTRFAAADGMSLGDMVEETFARFQRHVEVMLLRDGLPMPARVLPKASQRFKGDYDHLARTEEWTLLDVGEDES
ncbi:double-strand break repair protein AddB [Pelagibacterium luteolum]|uniref:ATP-dependent helicase/nuclease subunit B n=1 Tax=Pelagibacterium luteolum TaxID=440168 RepID=A0A1G7SRK5_9HYPH|nr:double-strand break repair protein AddB [Pelagibacterium luteolum]SDG25695.1 ATP-dependent helicase/nuclease subunit B [Pelagibacterium luteolum]